jgi:hypothetical protein
MGLPTSPEMADKMCARKYAIENAGRVLRLHENCPLITYAGDFQRLLSLLIILFSN